MNGAAPFFDRNVERWLLYSESVKGRLRHDLVWYHLEQQLGSIKESMRVLDAGCGLGDMAFALFDKVEKLVLLDFSEKMIEGAKKRLAAQYPAIDQARITFIHAPVEELESGLPQGTFHLIVCHNTLEYLEEPQAALESLVKRLAPRGLISLVVANRFSEAFKLALAKFDLVGARLVLHTKNSTADLFDHAPKRTFSFEELEEMAGELELKVVARHGIRIFADYLPESVAKDPENFQLLFELEKQAASQPPYIHVARYLQVICKKEMAGSIL
jgi:ubiquinone/menaquinone biosynthesis C-methylase UbiE